MQGQIPVLVDPTPALFLFFGAHSLQQKLRGARKERTVVQCVVDGTVPPRRSVIPAVVYKNLNDLIGCFEQMEATLLLRIANPLELLCEGGMNIFARERPPASIRYVNFKIFNFMTDL